MMKKLITALLLSTVAFAAHAQQGITTPVKPTEKAKIVATIPAATPTAAPSPAAALPAREMATKVAEVMPLDQQVNDLTETLAQTLPPAKQSVFRGIMKKNVDIVKLRAAAVDALMKTYTQAELQSMYEFYSKPGSKEIMAKMGKFGNLMQPTVESMMQKAVEDSKKAGLFEQQQ